MTLVITKQESSTTSYEKIDKEHFVIAHVVKGRTFTISLRVDHAPCNFITGKLDYELYYTNQRNYPRLVPFPQQDAFEVKVKSIRADGNVCDIDCRINELTLPNRVRTFALRIRLSANGNFVATSTGLIRTWAKKVRLINVPGGDNDEWTQVKTVKRPRVDTSLEATFAAFIAACDRVSADERPTKIRRLIADLPDERQTLANDVGYFLSLREIPPPPVQWPMVADDPILSSTGESSEFIDVDSFFM
jgi:hypothetical protein